MREVVEEFCRFFMKERTRDASSIPRHALAFALGKDKTKFFEYMNHISQKYIGKSLSQDDVLAIWLYMLNYGGRLDLELGQHHFHRIVFPSKHAYTVQVYTKSAELPTFLERLSAGIKGDKEYYIMFFYSKALNRIVHSTHTDRINLEEIELMLSSYPKDLEVSFWARGFLYKGFSRLEDALELITQLHELRERTKEKTWLTLYKDSDIFINFLQSDDFWWTKDRYMQVAYKKIKYEIEDGKYLPLKLVELKSMPISDLVNFLGSKSYTAEYIEELLDFGKEFFQQMEETFKKRKKDISVEVKWKDSYEDTNLSAHAEIDRLDSEIEDKLWEDVVKLLEKKNLYLSSFLQGKVVSELLHLL